METTKWQMALSRNITARRAAAELQMRPHRYYALLSGREVPSGQEINDLAAWGGVSAEHVSRDLEERVAMRAVKLVDDLHAADHPDQDGSP